MKAKGVTQHEAIKKTKVTASTYFHAKKFMGKNGKLLTEPKAKRKYTRKASKTPQVIDVPVKHESAAKAVVIVCDPADVKEVVSNLFN